MTFAAYLKKLDDLYQSLGRTVPRREAATQVEAVERELGQALPAALRAAWRLTDGLNVGQTVFARQGRLTGYDFLSVKASLREREGVRRRAATYAKYREPEPRDPRIRAGWFDPGWMPFAGFGGGTLLLMLDLAPAPKGKAGQIIAFTHDPDQIEYIAPSFTKLLDVSWQALAADPDELLGGA